MKAEISKASSKDWKEERNISSLQEMVALIDEFESQIIVNWNGRELAITIYDDYVE